MKKERLNAKQILSWTIGISVGIVILIIGVAVAIRIWMGDPVKANVEAFGSGGGFEINKEERMKK